MIESANLQTSFSEKSVMVELTIEQLRVLRSLCADQPWLNTPELQLAYAIYSAIPRKPRDGATRPLFPSMVPGDFEAWLANRVANDSASSVSASAAYHDFCFWCRSTRTRIPSQRAFGVAMSSIYERKKSNGIHYLGISLRDPGTHGRRPLTESVDYPPKGGTRLYPAIPLDSKAPEPKPTTRHRRASPHPDSPRPLRPAVSAMPEEDFSNEPDLRYLPGKLWPESLAYQRAQEEKARQSANGSHSGDSRPIPDDPSS